MTPEDAPCTRTEREEGPDAAQRDSLYSSLLTLIFGFVQILACLALGDLVVALAGVPVPGAILGMMLLLIVLSVKGQLKGDGQGHGEGIAAIRVSDRLLALLPLFFVPAGTGVIALVARIRLDALPLLAGLVLSWAAGLAVTAVVSRFALKAQNGFRSRRAS